MTVGGDRYVVVVVAEDVSPRDAALFHGGGKDVEEANQIVLARNFGAKAIIAAEDHKIKHFHTVHLLFGKEDGEVFKRCAKILEEL